MAAVNAAVAELLEHLAQRPATREVILSGGGPMTLPLEALARILEPLAAHPQVNSISVRTKTIAFAPKVFDDAAKRALLAAAGVRLMFHFAHPDEPCDAVRATIARLRGDGIRCYNQFVLLRNVNDHADLLIEHLTLLDDLQVRNLSVFLPEPIIGSAPFRMTFARFERIADTLDRSAPSWINATRFVLDTPVGKVRREDVVARDPAAGTITFRRGDRRIDYPDLPEALDRPGRLSTIGCGVAGPRSHERADSSARHDRARTISASNSEIVRACVRERLTDPGRAGRSLHSAVARHACAH